MIVVRGTRFPKPATAASPGERSPTDYERISAKHPRVGQGQRTSTISARSARATTTSSRSGLDETDHVWKFMLHLACAASAIGSARTSSSLRSATCTHHLKDLLDKDSSAYLREGIVGTSRRLRRGFRRVGECATATLTNRTLMMDAVIAAAHREAAAAACVLVASTPSTVTTTTSRARASLRQRRVRDAQVALP